MIRRLLGFVLFASLLHGRSDAQNFRNEFGFKSDNDAYLAQGSDRYYTNGLFINFRHAAKDTGKFLKKTWELTAGQRMYNAQSGYLPDITYADRPVTAYLYGGGSLHYFYENGKALSLGIQAGMIGPAALGRQAQEIIHRLAGFYKPNSWQYQLKNEAQLNSSASLVSPLLGAGTAADLSIQTDLDLGTTFSGAAVSFLFRTGRQNVLSESAALNSRISGSETAAPQGRELYLFLRPRLAYVLYDATIEGGLLRNDKGPVTYDSKPLVLSQELGVQFASKRWTADFSAVFLTKQVESSARAHQFGSIDLYYRFN